MKSVRYFLIFTALLYATASAHSQMYILSEDFSLATGILPPANWQNNTIAGGASAKWHFDNPGNRTINFPVTVPFAIFDAQQVSPDTAVEKVSLETPFFDASIGSYCLLFIDHYFKADIGALGKILAFNGASWIEVTSFSTTSLSNPGHEIIDLSAVCAGITNAKLRFQWEGHGKGYWAIDNIRIYSPLQLDAGISAISNPVVPFTAGLQSVEVSLSNFGYQTLTNAILKWSVNGVMQPPFAWSGSLGYGSKIDNIALGNFNFLPSGGNLVKAWSDQPNGNPDPNPTNDTTALLFYSSLCGTYTIGGTNPDFATFGQAVDFLNQGGITCPVIFKVRNGTYNERFTINQVFGSSSVNTVTFESESGDSSQVILQSSLAQPIVELIGAQHIIFNQITILSNYTIYGESCSIKIDNNASDILIGHCRIWRNNWGSSAINIVGNSNRVSIHSNLFTGIGSYYIYGNYPGEVEIDNNQMVGNFNYGVQLNALHRATIKDNVIKSNSYGIFLGPVQNCRIIHNSISGQNENLPGYSGIFSASYSVDTLIISNNTISNQQTGIRLDGNGSNATGSYQISSNRITRVTSLGIYLNFKYRTGKVYNNFIQVSGNSLAAGIKVENNRKKVQVVYNNVNVTNSHPQSRALETLNSDSLLARNNIFSNPGGGFAAWLQPKPLASSWDYNDYFSSSGKIGFVNDTTFYTLDSWRTAIQGEFNGKNANPFFASDTSLTPGQIALNSSGTPLDGILYDIDSIPRNAQNPDIGAKEFEPCEVDAGIDKVSAPVNPLIPGVQEVKVILGNQGAGALYSAVINWDVNSLAQTPLFWTGTLASGQSIEIMLGYFDFQALTAYQVTATVGNPNNQSDCNSCNNSSCSPFLYPALCGAYTIGGTNPDFQSFSHAIAFLNSAGVTCPVVFKVRNGTYNEHPEINDIPGTTAINTVTFQSESGDSSLAIIQSTQFLKIVYLNGARYVNFVKLGFMGYGGIFIGNSSQDIHVSNCNFMLHSFTDNRIVVDGYSTNITLSKNRVSNVSGPVGSGGTAISLSQAGNVSVIENVLNGGFYGITTNNTTDITIRGNRITGAYNYGVSASGFRKIRITGNQLDFCKYSIYTSNIYNPILTDSVFICNNEIKNPVIGIQVNGDYYYSIHPTSDYFLISGNKVTGVTGRGIYCMNSKNRPSSIVNNFIQTTGTKQTIGIMVENSLTSMKLACNSINVTGLNTLSRAFEVKNSGSLTIKNNIFSNPGGGFAAFLDTIPAASTLDFNDYYSATNKIGSLHNTVYPTLSSWKLAIQGETNAGNVNPLYTSPTNLKPNQVVLNNAGTPISGIIYDIDSTLRNPATPDVGAKEFGLCSADAGTEQVTSPVNPLSPGIQPVKVILRNQGTAALNSVTLHCEVNGFVLPVFQWTGALISGQSAEVNIGDFDFPATGTSLVKIWSSSPNNLVDCNHFNDTISSLKLYPPLCGTYTIGGSNPDFENLSEPVEYLNYSGITCPVVFKVRNGTYNTEIEINQIMGATAANRVTIESEGGDSSLVILQDSTDNPVIYFNGAGYVNVKQMHIRSNFQGYSEGIVKMNGNAHDISFLNCQVSANLHYGGFVSILGKSNRITVNNGRFICNNYGTAVQITDAGEVEIQDNVILQPGVGVYCEVVNSATMMNNRITGATSMGINISDFRKARISGNLIENTSTTGMSINNWSNNEVRNDTVILSSNEIKNANIGILLNCNSSYHKTNWQIAGNMLTDIASQGMQINSNSQNSFGLIANNFIQLAGPVASSGISIQYAKNIQLIFNSIIVSGSNTQSKAIEVINSESLTFRNNILSNFSGGYALYHSVMPLQSSWDFNNYFSNSNKIGYLNGTNYTTLPLWSAAIGGEANGRNVNPYYASDSSYQVYQRALNGAGIPFAGVPFDIEGQIRNNQAPDIGAWEFTVDFGITQVLNPTLSCSHSSPDSLTIWIRQFGDIPFVNIKLAYRINNGPVVYDSIVGTTYNDMTYTFSQAVNLTTSGTYAIKCWLVNNLDDNISNDTITVMRYSYPSPVADFSFGNTCVGQPVQFTSNAHVIPPYTIASYAWMFGDPASGSFDTAFLQNPTHIFQQTGSYLVRLKAFSNMGCYGDTIKPVLINPSQNAQISISANNDTVCPGTSVTFTAIVLNGGASPIYQWKVNAVNAGTNSAVYTYTPLPGDTVTCELSSNTTCFSGIIVISNQVAMTVIAQTPAPAGIVSGPVAVCVGAQGVVYSVSPIPNATNYLWFLPPGASIASGTGTSSIAVNFPLNAFTGNISVQGINDCGSGILSPLLSVDINTLLTGKILLRNITIPATDQACLAAESIFTAGGGTIFLVQGGAEVTLIASQNIRFLPGTTVMLNASLHAFITSGCVPCSAFKIVQAETDSSFALPPGEVTEQHRERPSPVVYPNPFTGSFNLEFQNETGLEPVYVEIYNLQGEKLLTREITGAGRHVFSLTGIPAGICFLRLITAAGIDNIKLVKQ